MGQQPRIVRSHTGEHLHMLDSEIPTPQRLTHLGERHQIMCRRHDRAHRAEALAGLATYPILRTAGAISGPLRRMREATAQHRQRPINLAAYAQEVQHRVTE